MDPFDFIRRCTVGPGVPPARLVPFIALGRTHVAGPGEVSFKFWLQGAGSEAQLARAVRLSVDALSVIWPKGIVQAVMKDSWIFVRPTSSWTDAAGRQVGGLTYDRGMEVGVNLWQVCHELAHFVQLRWERQIDADHAKWDQKGITAAIAVYRKAL